MSTPARSHRRVQPRGKLRRDPRVATLEQHQAGRGDRREDPGVQRVVVGVDLEQRLRAQEQRNSLRQSEPLA
jgi:hypothetical protein